MICWLTFGDVLVRVLVLVPEPVLVPVLALVTVIVLVLDGGQLEV